MPQATSVSLAAQLLGRFTSVTQAVQRAEMQLILQEAINGMDPIDREIVALRHFEELSNEETAQVLGIKPSAASTRHVRALKRLREVLQKIPGFLLPGRTRRRDPARPIRRPRGRSRARSKPAGPWRGWSRRSLPGGKRPFTWPVPPISTRCTTATISRNSWRGCRSPGRSDEASPRPSPPAPSKWPPIRFRDSIGA